MLVILRRPGERLHVGDTIINIVDLKDDAVRLFIQQPDGDEQAVSLSRDETVKICDGEATLTVVLIQDDKMRLGVEAPSSMPIHRGEIYDALKRAQAEMNDS